jgi:NDP-sugar pyrophosphorylase family protein
MRMTKMKEAIILGGGEGKRLKPYSSVSKPLLKLNDDTLIDFQLKWLRTHGFNRIIVPSKEPLPTSEPVIHVEEGKKLGTGGAIKLALPQIQGERVYVMNVDDIITYDPARLMKEAYLGGAILVTRPKSGFGKVQFNAKGTIIKFEEKPKLPWCCSVGHYAFKKKILDKYLPDKGNIELETFPKMAHKKLLRAIEYDGIWITINTIKELEEARKALPAIKRL